MTIHKEKGGSIIEMPDIAYTYQVAETPRDFDKRTISGDTLYWNNVHNFIGDFLIYPYGSHNNLDQIIKDVVDNSYNVPGFLSRKIDIAWGAGPKLYRDELIDNKDVRVRVVDPAIQRWLESFKHEEYLLKCMADYQHIQSTYTRAELNKGSRIGKPFINKLHHVLPNHARLARLRNSIDNDPTHVVTSSWNFNNITAISDHKYYPLFDISNPFAAENTIIHSNRYTFCTDYYNVPALYGAIEWINRSTAVPLIFKAFAKNSMNLKYHIVSPASFWDRKRKEMIDNCTRENSTYNESMMIRYEREFLKQIGDVLSGYENAGKYFHTTMGMTVKGHDIIQEGWTVNVLDQKVKDFVSSQILISDKADKAIAAGINIHPVLANMTDTGKANSGSEQIYALLNYLNTGVDIDEMIVCKPINYALKANFPDSGLKIGFFHNAPEMQQNTTPAKRSKNSTQKDATTI